MKNFLRSLAGIFAACLLMACSGQPISLSERIQLNTHWRVQQSEKINLPGSVVSGMVVDTAGWYKAEVPSTIMGVLTGNGLYKDLFMGDSLARIGNEQFRKSWWYRTGFILPELNKDQRVHLCFDGISYYANVWLNSTLVASRDSVYGTYRTFSLDITDILKDSVNILAVEVFKRNPGDFGHGFVDWNPKPPDESMGIWRAVFLSITGDVAITNSHVRTDALSQELDEASLSVHTGLVNYSERAVSGKLIGKSKDFEFSVPVHLKGNERRTVVLTPDDVKSLKVTDPDLWWCNNLGEPNLHKMHIQFVTNGAISDEKDCTFGIRTVATYTTDKGHKGFKLNGREVLIKGAGWTDDIFLRDTPEQNEIQVQYVKHMNLNTIRFENFWGTSQNIYDLCDRYGILAMIGWSCQWEWENYLGKPCDEFGGIKTEAEMTLMVESLGDQIQYLQHHPSIFVWLLASDMLPRPALETRYRDLIAAMDDRPYLASASVRVSEVSGPTGMKMLGPYEYVTPLYWYIDSVNGGAYGFNTETGPGPQLPVKESILRMIPEDKLWPLNEIWNYHCTPAREAFNNLDVFNNVLYQRYGKPITLDNYLLKSDVQSYEAMKGMFEAFRANLPATTGVIQWMLNSAWPSFYWQLHDYYLLPTASYYATRKANNPVQLIYNYGNNKLYAVNETLIGLNRVKAEIRLTDINGKNVFTDERMISLESSLSKEVLKLPDIRGVMFLSLRLMIDAEVLADNFYWLAGKPDEYDWENTTWFYTPLKSSSDFKPLNYLPMADVAVSFSKSREDDRVVIDVKVTNSSGKPAFFINLGLKDPENKTIFPVFWEDNYFSLLPGDERIIRCELPDSPAIQHEMILTAGGWNVKELVMKIAP